MQTDRILLKQNSSENISKNIGNLQGIRGYAILLVFLAHCRLEFNGAGLKMLVCQGASLFVMLSGYLLLERHYGEPLCLRSYAKRKFVKFYPLHIATLALTLPLLLDKLTSGDPKAWLGLFCNITLLQAWVPDPFVFFSYNSVAWYLSVLAFLIVISPLVLNFWKRHGESKARIALILLGLIIFDIIWCALFRNNRLSRWLIYILPIARVAEYIMGGGVWLLVKSMKLNDRAYDATGIFAITTSIILMFLSSFNVAGDWFFVAAWLVPSMLMTAFAASNTSISRVIFSNRVIRAIGDISFEIFLIHSVYTKYIYYKYMAHTQLGMKAVAGIACLNFIASVLTAIIWKRLYLLVVSCLKKRKSDNPK